MGILGKRALFEALRSFDTSTASGTYQVFGTILLNPSVLMKIVNSSTVAIVISFNGVTDQDLIPAGSFVIYDFGSDAQDVSAGGRLSLAAGTQVYLRSATGGVGVGNAYLVTVYAGD